MLVQHDTGAAHKAVAQVAFQPCFVRQDQLVLAICDDDGAGDQQLFGVAVIGDLGRPQPGIALKNLDISFGDQAGAAIQPDLVGHQHRRHRLVVLLGVQDGGQQQREGEGNEAQEAGHPSSICRSRPMAKSKDATGGAQAASATGTWPVSPRIWTKLRM